MSGFVRLHGDRFRHFTEELNLLEKASVLLWCKFKHIKLGIFIPHSRLICIAALRFFRHCLGVIGDAYSNRMIKSHSFEPIIDVLIESSARNSLLNSAVLELLHFVLKVYFLSMAAAYIHRKIKRPSSSTLSKRMVNVSSRLKLSVSLNKLIESMHNTMTPQWRLRMPEAKQSIGTTDIVITLTPSRHQQPNGVDRWATGIKEMDSAEEDYFNGDEEEEVPVEVMPAAELNIEKPFEVKRRRCIEDDGDDELLQLAQGSPHSKGKPLLLP